MCRALLISFETCRNPRNRTVFVAITLKVLPIVYQKDLNISYKNNVNTKLLYHYISAIILDPLLATLDTIIQLHLKST